jgi:hypothetical protein
MPPVVLGGVQVPSIDIAEDKPKKVYHEEKEHINYLYSKLHRKCLILGDKHPCARYTPLRSLALNRVAD